MAAKGVAGLLRAAGPLGALLDLRGARSGEILVCNRPERVKELAGDIDEYLNAGGHARHTLLKLRGRILFSRQLCFGRFATRALKAVNAFCAASDARGAACSSGSLDSELHGALRLLARVILETPPRRILVSYPSPVLLFTDAAFDLAGEVPRIGLGGVLFDRDSHAFEFFGMVLEVRVAEELLEYTANPIAEAETIAMAIALNGWAEKLRGRALLGFIDNESSRHALVKGGSSGVLLSGACDFVTNAEIGLQVAAYWERVPSSSNISDAPPRGFTPPQVSGWHPPHARKFSRVLAEMNVQLGACRFYWGARDMHQFC